MSRNAYYTLIKGDALSEVKKIKTASIDCIITSPPYWQLRDYGFTGQWGLEAHFEDYLNKLYALMDEIKRVLKPQGTVWINLGDTYGTASGTMGTGRKQPKFSGSANAVIDFKQIKPKAFTKSLLLIPHRFAIGCMERGWLVRNDIIWAKPNAMPEAVKDRFSKKHEYVFFMTKQKDYYFDLDAVRDAHKESSIKRAKGTWNGHKEPGTSFQNFDNRRALHPNGKNPGTVSDFWSIATNPGRAKHYAKFSTRLISKPIIAGCPKGGIILDPFCGTSTTGVEALRSGRNFIGIDGNAEFIKISENNLKQIRALQGIFNMQYQKEIIAEIDDSKRPVIVIKVTSPVKEKLSIDFKKPIAKRQFFGLFSRLYDLAESIQPENKAQYMNETVAKLFKYYQEEFKATGIKLPVYESTADTIQKKKSQNAVRAKALKLEKLLNLLEI